VTALDDLVDLLDLERLEENLFRGVSPPEHRGQRVFGGQVAAQSLVAATRTLQPAVRGEVPGVHSLHAYFLREGDTSVPIVFEVDRIRDGRSFATRRVVAIQHGRAIFNLQASFHVHEDGPVHSVPFPDVPTVDESHRVRDVVREFAPWAPEARESPIEMHWTRQQYLPDPVSKETGLPGPDLSGWWRTAGRLPDDPALHAAIATYASDMMIMDCAMLPHGLAYYLGNVMAASLDHAMWFHRSFRADEWMLYVQRSPAAAHARGLAIGEMFRADGQLAITVVQEGLMRPLDAEHHRRPQGLPPLRYEDPATAPPERDA
jgi:acyl-CoA thioesterase II